MSSDQSHSGKCLCGAVQFIAEGVETHFHACHCSMCRNWSGGPMMAVNTADVKFQGEDKIKRYASSEWAERGFCSECGSNLFYRLKEGGNYIMTIGAFADESPFSIAGEIFVDEKPPGYNFAGDHPRQTGEEFLASLGMAPPA